MSLNEQQIMHIVREQLNVNPEDIEVIEEDDKGVVVALINYDEGFDLDEVKEMIPPVFVKQHHGVFEYSYGGTEDYYSDHDWKPVVFYNEFMENENLKNIIMDTFRCEEKEELSAEMLEELEVIEKGADYLNEMYSDYIRELLGSSIKNHLDHLSDFIEEVASMPQYNYLLSREKTDFNQFLALVTFAAEEAYRERKMVKNLFDLMKFDNRDELGALYEKTSGRLMEVNEIIFDELYDALLKSMDEEDAIAIWEAKGHVAKTFNVEGRKVLLVGDKGWEELNNLTDAPLSRKEEVFELQADDIFIPLMRNEVYALEVVKIDNDGNVERITEEPESIIGRHNISEEAAYILQSYKEYQQKQNNIMMPGV